ncbi:hypothetical protein MTO96_002659 [Rhipicephalus appendiculatus]
MNKGKRAPLSHPIDRIKCNGAVERSCVPRGWKAHTLDERRKPRIYDGALCGLNQWLPPRGDPPPIGGSVTNARAAPNACHASGRVERAFTDRRACRAAGELGGCSHVPKAGCLSPPPSKRGTHIADRLAPLLEHPALHSGQRRSGGAHGAGCPGCMLYRKAAE